MGLCCQALVELDQRPIGDQDLVEASERMLQLRCSLLQLRHRVFDQPPEQLRHFGREARIEGGRRQRLAVQRS